jgi:N-acetylglucosamine-6-phosphate deacetylase
MNKSNGKGLLLHNSRLVLPDRVVEQGAVLLENEHIALITPASTRLGNQEQVDLQGLTLFPGFIDVHIHGAVGVDTLDAEQPDLGRVSRFLASNGVTAWLPTLVPAATAVYARSIKAIAESMKEQAQLAGAERGARVLGVHYEGPFVNSHQCGALRSEFFRTFSGAEDLDDLPRIVGEHAGHLITVAPEIAGGVELVRELHRRGWIVSLGHTRAGFAVLEQAFAAGARHMTHFMNAMSPLHHRAPGPIGWGLLQDDVTCDVIADGIHLDRDMLRLLLKLKGANRLLLISDAIAAAGKGDGEYEIWDQTITVKDGRTSNAAGAIAGSVISMLDAVRVMKSIGASDVELARMAASNPARLLGIADECGSIEVGKRADLVALDAGGKVVLTLVGGAVAFDERINFGVR